MNGELRRVESVQAAFTDIVASAMKSALESVPSRESFRLGCSGGRSGAASFAALSRRDDLDWGKIHCYFVDERCVDPGSPESNAKTIGDAFGDRLGSLGGFFPMSCKQGAKSYEEKIKAIGRFDIMQLGLGPDGHTASLFPRSPGLDAPEDELVTMNEDPSGFNKFPRMSLTYSGIARADRVVFTVIGDDSAEALARVVKGEDLPASRVDGDSIIWLADREACSKIGSNLAP